jgi:hypothetical protein
VNENTNAPSVTNLPEIVTAGESAALNGQRRDTPHREKRA